MRDEILDTAKNLINGDRAKDYGDAYELHQKIAVGWKVILGVDVRPYHVAQCMAWLKTCRQTVTPDHKDSYVDQAAYTALAYELQQREEEALKDVRDNNPHEEPSEETQDPIGFWPLRMCV